MNPGVPRLLPPLVLLLLSPFVGEFLLGNLPPDPLAWATTLLPLVLLYGGGALLIREIARRLGRGYPIMVILALAYALLEEGIVLGTLFNREYLGLGLLEYGWLPQFGTSPVWASYVIGIHAVWSILVPIVLTEHLFPARSKRPWLGIPGTLVVALIYLLGATVIGAGNYYTYRFFPSLTQTLIVLVLVGASVGAGLLIRASRTSPRAGRPPAPRILAIVTFLGSSLFILAQSVGSTYELLPAGLTLVIMAAAVAATTATLMAASRRGGWTRRHTFGATAGALATYGWAGFLVQFSVHGFSVLGLASQTVFVVIAIALMALWKNRLTRPVPDSA